MNVQCTEAGPNICTKYVRRSKVIDGINYVASGKTIAEALAKLEEIRRKLEAGEFVRQNAKKRRKAGINSSTSVAVFAGYWLETEVEPRVRDASSKFSKGSMLSKEFKTYKSHMKNYILPEIGELAIGEVKAKHLKSILNKQKKAGLSKSTMKKTKSFLEQMFGDAYYDEIIPRNPAGRLKTPEGTVRERDCLNDEEITALLAVSEKYEYGAVVRLEYNSGMRNSEIAALKVGDLDFETGIIEITTALKGGEGKIGDTKSKKSTRYIALEYMDNRDELFELCAGKNPDDFLFTMERDDSNHTITHMSEDYMQYHFNKIRRETAALLCGTETIPNNSKKVKQCSEAYQHQYNRLEFYCLRHTVCSDLLDAGVSAKDENSYIGHLKEASNAYDHHNKIKAALAVGRTLAEHRNQEKNNT